MTRTTLERKIRAELKAGKVRFGKVTLPLQKDLSPFIPHLLEYQDHDKILETLAYAVAGDLPCLLIGETGVGKTAAVRHMAARTPSTFVAAMADPSPDPSMTMPASASPRAT